MQTCIHQSKMLDDKTGTLLVSISYTAQERAQEVDTAEIFSSISAHTNHNLIPIAGSFVKLDNGSSQYTDVVACKVAKGVHVLPYTENHAFKSVSGNLFMDDAENFWSLSDVDGSKVFIKDADAETQDELQVMLNSVSSTETQVGNNYIRNAARELFDSLQRVVATDLVLFAKDGKVGHGSVCPVDEANPNMLQVCTSSEVIDVPREAVIMSLSSDQFAGNLEEPEYESVSGNLDGAQKLIEYFTKVYAHNEEYLSQLVDRIKNHAFA